MFYASFMLIGSWKGRTNLRVRIFLNKIKLVRVGLQETNNFFLGLMYPILIILFHRLGSSLNGEQFTGN